MLDFLLSLLLQLCGNIWSRKKCKISQICKIVFSIKCFPHYVSSCIFQKFWIKLSFLQYALQIEALETLYVKKLTVLQNSTMCSVTSQFPSHQSTSDECQSKIWSWLIGDMIGKMCKKSVHDSENHLRFCKIIATFQLIDLSYRSFPFESESGSVLQLIYMQMCMVEGEDKIRIK